VIDAASCENPISVTSPQANNIPQQEYTITADQLVYQLQPFETDPPNCPVTYTISVDNGISGAQID